MNKDDSDNVFNFKANIEINVVFMFIDVIKYVQK